MTKKVTYSSLLKDDPYEYEVGATVDNVHKT